MKVLLIVDESYDNTKIVYQIYNYLKKKIKILLVKLTSNKDDKNLDNDPYFILVKSLKCLKERQNIVEDITDTFGYPNKIILLQHRKYLNNIKSMFIFSNIIEIAIDKENEESNNSLINNIFFIKYSQNTFNEYIDKLIKLLEIKKKILICSTQYPGYGGAASNTYKLFKCLQTMDFNVCAIFFENKYPKDLVINNSNVILFKRILKKEDTIKIENILGGPPDEIYCKNWLSPVIISRWYGYKKTIYLVSGSLQLTQFANNKNYLFAQDILKLNNNQINKLISQISAENIKAILLENDVLQNAKFIIFNSNLTQEIFKKLYKFTSKKVLISDTSNIKINDNLLTERTNMNSSKDYDIAFVSSSLQRLVKNFALFKKICNHEKIKSYKKIIIGNGSNDELDGIDNFVHFKKLSNIEVEQYLSRTRLLIITSLYDSSPNILREALHNNCKVMTSPNIGSAIYLDEEYICDDYLNIKSWVEKVIKILQSTK